MKRSEALKLREMIEKAAISLSDTDALESVKLFPSWTVGVQYAADFRIRYKDKLYKVLQAHTSQADWTPDSAPSLYTEVAKPGEIDVWRQPTGAQDAYMTGDEVWYPEKDTTVYRSTIDNNVWIPADYPAGWEVVT